MSDYLRIAKNAINRHGVIVTFKRVSVPTYNNFTSQATSTEVPFVIKAYPKQVVANQYNMPSMLGREVVEFYIYAPDVSSIAPKINDKVNYKSTDYTAFAVREHMALGAVVLYKVMCVKA